MFDNFSRVEMFEALEKRNPKFDAVASSFTSIRKFGIKDINGEFTFCGGFQAFVPIWNNLFGAHIHPASFQSGKRFYVQWVEGSEEVTPVKPSVNTDPVTTASLITLDVEEPISVQKEVNVPTKEVDWEWVESLENKKYDREKLDVYASDNFGINLNRKFTITNMVKKFKEELNAL